MAESVDFTVRQGVTFDHTATWEIGPDVDNLTLVNLTGYTAAMQIRATYASTTTVAALTHSSGLTLGGAAGTIQIQLSAAATAALAARTYVYDLEVTSASGTVTGIIAGTFTVTPEVTR